MDKKRIAIPEMALVRRPSLIDARPPFLAQIEANERAAKMRQPREPVKKRIPRKKPVATFDSDIDVTAIAAIEPSEVSSAKSGKAIINRAFIFMMSAENFNQVFFFFYETL